MTNTPNTTDTATIPLMPATISRRAKSLLLKWPDGWDRILSEDVASVFPEGALLCSDRDEKRRVRKFRLSPYGAAMRAALIAKEPPDVRA